MALRARLMVMAVMAAVVAVGLALESCAQGGEWTTTTPEVDGITPGHCSATSMMGPSMASGTAAMVSNSPGLETIPSKPPNRTGA